MREPEIRKLGETTYELRPLNTSAMLRLMSKLTKLLGPSIAELTHPAELVRMANIGRTLATLAESLDEEVVLEVCRVLSEHTSIISGDRKLPLGGGTAAQWETHFQGDPVGLFRWLGAALEVNFGPLAAWAAAQTKALPPATAAAPGA